MKAAGITLRLCLLLLGVIAAGPSQAQVNTDEVIEMGRAAMFYDDYITAIHYFNRAIDAKPYLAEAHYQRGYAQFSLADYEAAEEDLNRAVTFNPFRVEYFQLRGLCRIHNLNYRGACEDYTRVLEDRPNDQNAHFNRALCSLELKDYSATHADLDYIIAHWPTFARSYVVKAQSYLEVGDTLRGIYWIDSLLVLSKNEPDAWSVKGRYALQHADYANAEQYYTQALKYDAGCEEYYMKRALARFALRRYEQALIDCERVVGMNPDNSIARQNAEMLRGLLKHPQQSTSASAHFLVADTIRKPRSLMEEFKGKVEHRKAERVFLPPYRVEGNHLVVEGGRHPMYCGDAIFLNILRRTDVEAGVPIAEAIARLRNYLDDPEVDAVLLYNLGCLEVQNGTLDEAERIFSLAIERDPLLAEAYYNKGVALLLQNKHEAATALLKKSADMGIVKAYNLLTHAKQ